jgi:hypothetical protein
MNPGSSLSTRRVVRSGAFSPCHASGKSKGGPDRASWRSKSDPTVVRSNSDSLGLTQWGQF